MMDETFIRDFFGMPARRAKPQDISKMVWELPGDPKTPVIWVNGIPYHQVFENIGGHPNGDIKFSVRLLPLKRIK